MYAIYGNIYHQYIPNVSIYTSTMDPMGSIIAPLKLTNRSSPRFPPCPEAGQATHPHLFLRLPNILASAVQKKRRAGHGKQSELEFITIGGRSLQLWPFTSYKYL